MTLVKDNTVGVVSNLEKIKIIRFRKANEYNENYSYDKVKKELVENDELLLKQDYWNSLKPISEITDFSFDFEDLDLNKTK